MTPQELVEQYAKDTKRKPNLGDMLFDISESLLPKYEGIQAEHTMKAKATEDNIKVLKKNKWLWYSGKLSKEELTTLGWPPFELRIPKSDYDKFINADHEVIRLEQLLTFYLEITRITKDLIWDLSNRHRSIGKVIDYERFLAGN